MRRYAAGFVAVAMLAGTQVVGRGVIVLDAVAVGGR